MESTVLIIIYMLDSTQCYSKTNTENKE